ncbi:MAG TPA: 6,7-dimethyl-8-ribityllumazine synthase [Spirochaetota bacterium]|mgnify:FL=1|nr:6,7-dimethyl-8-ribityllumazine synthase [Spirochaetota bacterium]
MKSINGSLDAQGKRFALVVGRFNSFISERLIEGALDCIVRHGGTEDAVTVIRVPGSFEITAAVRAAVDSGRYDAVITLGALIRGSTPHFDYVARSVTTGVSAIAAEAKTVVTFGVLTTDTIEQAIERAGTKSGNKGFDAAMAAIEMVNLLAAVRNGG